MAVALRSAGTRGTTAPGVPAGVTTGDVIVLTVTGNSFTANTIPLVSGFTLKEIVYHNVNVGRYLAVLVREWQSGDPTTGTYAVTISGSGTAANSQAYAYTGADAAGIAVSEATNNTSATTSPPITVSAPADDYLMYMYATAGGNITLTSVPGGWAEISTTTTAVMHTIGRVSAGGSTGAVQVTGSTGSTARTALLVVVPALDEEEEPPPENQNAGFFALAG